jgi:O-antigen ligase
VSTRLTKLLSRVQEVSTIDWLLLALFATASFQYWFGSGPLLIALVEPAELLVLLYLLGLFPGQSEKPKGSMRSLSWVWLGLSAWAIISWLLAGDWPYGLNDIRQLALASAVFAALMARPDLKVGRISFLLVLVTVLSAVVADSQSLTGWFVPPFSASPIKQLLNPLRGVTVPVAEGFFRNGNVFAAFVFWPFLICLAEAFRGTRRAWAAGGAVLLGISLILSLGRGVIAGAALGTMLLAVFLSGLAPGRKMALAAGIFAFAVGFVVSLAATVPESGFFLSLGLRRTLWDAAIELMRRTPSFLVTGVGAHQVSYLQGFAALGRDDPHDLYLYMLVHYGILGLAVIALTLATVLRTGWLSLKAERLRNNYLHAALLAGWIAFWVMGLLDSYFTDAEFRFLFVVMLALFLKTAAGRPSEGAKIDPLAAEG